MSGLKRSHGFFPSIPKTLRFSRDGGNKEGSARGAPVWDNEELHCNAEELKFLIPPVSINTIQRRLKTNLS